LNARSDSEAGSPLQVFDLPREGGTPGRAVGRAAGPALGDPSAAGA